MRFATALGSFALLTFGALPAFADCIPGTGLCASAGAAVGLPGLPVPGVQANGQITIGLPPLFSPAPQAAPLPPPPQVVVAPQGPPPPVFVYPQGGPPPPYYTRSAPPPFWGASKLGIDVRVDGAAGFGANARQEAYGVGGAGLGLRYRATPHFGFELGMDVLGGRDYNANQTVEVSGNVGGLVFFNPRSRVQVYLSGGFLADRAKASPTPGPFTLTTTSQDLVYNHVGGYAGLGLEFFVTRHLSFHLDARGIVRQNVDGNTPEFTDPTTGRTTNTSTGLVGQGGAVFYF
jgi:hypothetical protein